MISVSHFFHKRKNEEQKRKLFFFRGLEAFPQPPERHSGMNDSIVSSEHDVTASLSTFVLPRLIQVSVTTIREVGTRKFNTFVAKEVKTLSDSGVHTSSACRRYHAQDSRKDSL
jgi:hypothetical protein